MKVTQHRLCACAEDPWMSIGRTWTAEETFLRQFERLLQPFRRREHLQVADLAVDCLSVKVVNGRVWY
jgi:hypothetical protein